MGQSAYTTREPPLRLIFRRRRDATSMIEKGKSDELIRLTPFHRTLATRGDYPAFFSSLSCISKVAAAFWLLLHSQNLVRKNRRLEGRRSAT